MKATGNLIKDLTLAIRNYSGAIPTNVRLSPDPKVKGTYAIRCNGPKNAIWDFLITQLPEKKTIEEIADHLEECEFEVWPPLSRGLQFYC